MSHCRFAVIVVLLLGFSPALAAEEGDEQIGYRTPPAPMAMS